MVTHNLNILANQLMALPKLVEKNATDLVRKVGIAIASNVIRATPVDTGLARGNWQISLTNPEMNVLARKVAQEAINEANRVTVLFKLSDKAIWITNNLPYINALNNGWSKQAPSGYIERTIESVHAIVEKNKLL